MIELINSLQGTTEGLRLALMMALSSAVAHAVFGALQKGRYDPWLSRAGIDVAALTLTAPVALFLVPWPQGWEWPMLLGVVIIHFAYKLNMALAYERAAYTVVYPVVRGSGALATVVLAALLLDEHFRPLQWFGIILLSAAIMVIALVNLHGVQAGRAALKAGVVWALAGGASVAAYTTYDAWAIRMTADPFTFLAWFFFLTAFDFPLLLIWRRWRGIGAPLPERISPVLLRGLCGALVAYVSFGGVMLGARLAPVGQVASLRETSTVFAALIGWVVLGEKVGLVRALLMGAIALGAILVQAG
jgi:drug/metabolite transporter (DMT)-like permease